MLKPLHPIDPETAAQLAQFREFTREQAQQAEARREEPLRTAHLAAGGYDVAPYDQETRRAFCDRDPSAHEVGRRRDAGFLHDWASTLQFSAEHPPTP